MLVKIGWHFYPSNEWLNEQISPLLIIRLPEVVSIISLNHFHRHLFSFVLSKDLLSLSPPNQWIDRSFHLRPSFLDLVAIVVERQIHFFVLRSEDRSFVRSFVSSFGRSPHGMHHLGLEFLPSRFYLKQRERERSMMKRDHHPTRSCMTNSGFAFCFFLGCQRKRLEKGRYAVPIGVVRFSTYHSELPKSSSFHW